MKKNPFRKSLLDAIYGIIWILKSERNFQIEMVALLINLFLIFFLHLSALDASLILLVSFAVLCLEILNTAIEKICDIIQPEYDERIRIIKDLTAGAVLLSAICAVIMAFYVYPKYLF